MDSIKNFFGGITGWKFLQEPLWRWAIFIIALIFILAAWGRVLSYMD